jgi:hypothetical protein
MRTLGRVRAAVAVIGVALLLPLVVAAPAGAATPEPTNSETGRLTIQLGEPEKLKTVKKADSADVDTKALDCALGVAIHSRTQSCSYGRIPITYRINGVPSGTANLYAKATAELNPRNRYEWKQTVQLRLTDPTSWPGLLTTASVGFDCNYCDVADSGERYLAPNSTETFEFTVSSPGRELVHDSIVPNATLDAPRHESDTIPVGDVFRPRCDNTPRITPQRLGGCVYPDVPALWQIDVANPRVDAVGWHVLWAQQNLAQPWGVIDSRYPLHRTFDQALQTANRNVACGDDVPRPPNRPDLTCDEYPFAQTYEGASRNPDYSCHFLDGPDNSREGSLRRASLNGQRVLENDPFYVQVINVPDAATQEEKFRAMGPVGCGSD